MVFFKTLTMKILCAELLIGTEVCLIYPYFHVIYCLSDQGGS